MEMLNFSAAGGIYRAAVKGVRTNPLGSAARSSRSGFFKKALLNG